MGLTQPTLQSARLVGGILELRRARRSGKNAEEVDEGGDGTVPRVSATPIELGNRPSAVFVSQRHGSLQNAENVQTQLLGVLTQIADLESLRDLRSGLSLLLDDVFEPDEPVPLRVDATQPRLELAATVTDLGSGHQEGPYPLKNVGDDRHALELAPRPPGECRVTVAGVNRSERLVQPVTDVFMVAPHELGV